MAKTLDRLLDTILEKATSEGVNHCLHRKPYRIEGHTSKYDPLFEDIAGYAIRMEGYDVFVLETSVKMHYGNYCDGKPIPEDNGKRMCLTLIKGNKKVLEAHKFIFERKQLNSLFSKWEIEYNKAAEILLESIC